ncbi:MutS protein homolog 3 [Saitozyma sp. JCM 24511]|nr:MutS protein homolog 3 [Saitozyma sp. JCM 24511]
MTAKAGDSQKQVSLHTFFKRKTPPSSLPSRAIDSPPADRGKTSGRGDDDFQIIDENDEGVIDFTGSPPAKRPRSGAGEGQVNGGATGGQRKTSLAQPTSSYFSQKKAAPPALGGLASGNTRVDPSRSTSSSSSSTVLSAYRMPRTSAARPTQSGSAFENYSLSGQPRLPDDTDTGPHGARSSGRERTREQQRRHDEWQRRVLAPGGVMPRRRSLALDEAAAAEARRLAGGDAGEGDEGAETPGMDEVAVEESEEEGRKAAEGVGSKLKAKYAAKGSDMAKGKSKGKKKEEIGPSGMTYTPLEKQFMEIKKENPDVLLMMEVGYKYKFHGDDAKAASRELGIAAFPSRNFYTASIPTHRLHIHVKKLISLGYKVGVISQTETAALKKVSENRNAPFTRELTHLFTAATYVEDPSLPSSSTMTEDPVVPGSTPPPTNALVAIVEMGMGGMAFDDRVRIGLVSVVPGTGDVVWDEFDDSQVRTELETRLTHLQPAELLLPKLGLSKATEKVLNHFAGNSRTSASSSVRIERIDKIPAYDAAFDYLTIFYNRKAKPAAKRTLGGRRDAEEIDMTGDSDEEQVSVIAQMESATGETSNGGDDTSPMGLAAGLPSEEAVLALVDFPKQVVVALSMAVKYMKSFGLENAFRHRSSFARFINRAHMLLSSNTLVNLEIYRNQTDGGLYGSLLWLLDHTKTRMGRRLMREWIGRPLLDVVALQARVDAIEEIMESNTYHMEKLRSLLVNMPDLVKGLTRVQYGKATPSELSTILVGLTRVGSEFKPNEGQVFTSALLNSILKILPTIREPARQFLGAVNIKAAKENNEADLWTDPDKYPDVQDAKDCISICESELDQHLKEIRKTVKRPSMNYVAVAGIEYLVEIPVRDAKAVPPRWVKVQSTKHVVRFHTPEVLRITKEREQHKETLAAASRRAFLSFQADVSECHALVVVSRQLAVIDCLMSLAQVAAASGYCKPEFTAEPELHIRDGRHPMVEMLRDQAYVPFDIDFSEGDGRAKVITGPNMAGKSSCVRATALIVCMAQIGSFVPASSVTLGIHDAVQTRMGASDEIGRGKSTFMVELSETSDILRTLTPRTLVILDELGRGTSTYDGVAIAYATLSHVAGVGCNTLFVTHYPMVAEELAKERPTQISNWHMSFSEMKLPDGSAEITFLYKLTPGLAEASFGVWCARLAGLPKTVLENAQLRADCLKVETQKRMMTALARRTQRLLQSTFSNVTDSAATLRTAEWLYEAVKLVVKE